MGSHELLVGTHGNCPRCLDAIYCDGPACPVHDREPAVDTEAAAVWERLWALSREVLRLCVDHCDWERDRIRRNPNAIARPYFAYGPQKRAARQLWELGLLNEDASSFAGTGADLYPSDLGRRVDAHGRRETGR